MTCSALVSVRKVDIADTFSPDDVQWLERCPGNGRIWEKMQITVKDLLAFSAINGP
jgi:hypothetical protein